MRAQASQATPFGWIEITNAALQRLRRELAEKGKGVVDEMGVLAIHTGYADYFFPGTSVLQTRPRYLFFVCWNFLWLAKQKGTTAANVAKRKDEGDLWVTSQLVATTGRPARAGNAPPNMEGIIGVRVFKEDNTRLPAQTVDFVYWTALHRWGFYKSRTAQERARLLRHWRGSSIRRVGDSTDDGQDDVVRDDSLAEFNVPALPTGWRSEELDRLDFDLTRHEAEWLQERLVALEEVVEGPCLLSKAAELCSQLSPERVRNPSSRPWNEPLVIEAARAANQLGRLTRASQASQLALYVRAIYAGLVEWSVEVTAVDTHSPTLRHYRDQLRRLVEDGGMRGAALALSLPELYLDVPRIPDLLRRCLQHVQSGLTRVSKGEDAETVFVNDVTHRLFETVERRRKGARARLPRTEVGAARRIGFNEKTISVYDLDYRWEQVHDLLLDLHLGLTRE